MDLLSREFNPNSHLILEASAGTGKTFSIQHLYIRHLVKDDNPLTVQQILVVTFTNAAVKELKSRIRATLKGLLEGDEWPDYLQAVDASKAYNKLKKAYLDFDEAEIFTIHGFAAKMLKEHSWVAHLGLQCSFVEPSMVLEMKREAVRDAIRSLDSSLFLKSQLKKLLKVDDLEDLVLDTQEEEPLKPDELLEALKKSPPVDSIRKALLRYTKANHVEDWLLAYEHFHDNPTIESLDELIGQGNPLKGVLREKNLRKRDVADPTADEDYFIRYTIPILEGAADVKALGARVKKIAQSYIDRTIQELESYGPDELLRLMHEKVQDKNFAEAVRAPYQLVMCDEFQDTDKLQWEIFKILFFDRVLYLVGDPKQSIYRFRGADIYTYLDAVEELKGVKGSLTRNWRSHPKLVEALNALFANDFIPLPKTKGWLPCPKVTAARPDIPSEGAHLHFLFVEKDVERELLAFTVQEIQKGIKSGRELADFVLIVKDRHQAKKAIKFLSDHQIPSHHVRKKNWEGAEEIEWIKLFLYLLDKPTDTSSLRRLLGSPLLQRSLTEVAEKSLSAEIGLLFDTKKILHEKGILAAWLHFTEHFSLKNGDMVLDLIDLLVDVPIGQLKAKLDRLYLGVGEESTTSIDEGAVPIISMHMSKGLEWDVVFALGLAMPQKRDGDEEVAELMRQLYVVMTRARDKLYLPVPKKDNGSIIRRFPLDFEAFVNDRKDLSIDYSFGVASIDHDLNLFKEVPTDVEKKKPSIVKRLDKIHSFTSLHKQEAIPNLGAPKEYDAEEKTPFTLPAGASIGSTIHTLFETVPLKLFHQDPEKLLAFINSALGNHPLRQWCQTLHEMLWHAFTTPLIPGFALKDVDPNHFLRETEFLFCEGDLWRTGSIDAVICHDDCVYLIDWKSNWLGSSLDDYRHGLTDAIDRSGYRLQAGLYEEAIKRVLGKRKFGGCLYLFLRGLTKSSGQVLLKGEPWE